MREADECLGLRLVRLTGLDEADHRRPSHRREGYQLAARQAGGKQMIGIGRGQHQDGVGRRLFEGLQQAVLRGLGHPLGICQQCYSEWRNEWFQAQELLERLLVRRRPAFRMKPDLFEPARLRAVIRPEVRMDLEARRLPFTQKQRLGECPSDSGFADRLLAGKAIGMGQTASALMSLQNRDGSLVSGDRGKASRYKCRASTSSRGWHGAHLNKSFLDRARSHSYSVGVSDSVAVSL